MAVTTTLREYAQRIGATEGWFYAESAAIWDSLLSWQSQQKLVGHMMEIGVHHAKAAAMMLLHSTNEQEMHFLIDLFLNEPKIHETLLRFRNPIPESVRLVKTDSRLIKHSPLMQEAAREFRWIHIDGEHSAGGVTNDMELAATLLAREGILVIDDFFSPLFPHITEAVYRFLMTHPDEFKMFLCGYNKAYLARPHFLHVVQDYCYEELLSDLEARGQTLSLSKTTFAAESTTFGIGPRTGRRLQGPGWDPEHIRY